MYIAVSYVRHHVIYTKGVSDDFRIGVGGTNFFFS